MDFQKPESWRKGQTLFNFFEWLRLMKGIQPNQSVRMADPFHIQDEEFDDLWTEYLEELKKGTKIE